MSTRTLVVVLDRAHGGYRSRGAAATRSATTSATTRDIRMAPARADAALVSVVAVGSDATNGRHDQRPTLDALAQRPRQVLANPLSGCGSPRGRAR